MNTGNAMVTSFISGIKYPVVVSVQVSNMNVSRLSFEGGKPSPWPESTPLPTLSEARSSARYRAGGWMVPAQPTLRVHL